jgi:UDP-glucuronate 4-epimerase
MSADLPQKPIFVTGAAGFIGFHLVRQLLSDGYQVVGFDNLNDYYDPRLKRSRLAQINSQTGWQSVIGDLADRDSLRAAMDLCADPIVVHLGAQAGVRWSLERPDQYVSSNLVGFANVLEECRTRKVSHLVYASSSSVYGLNGRVPFREDDTTDHPASLYAATKKANESMAHAYSHLFGLPCTGLRFFTVFGPWGRPDMAYWRFCDAILDRRPIEVFGGGELKRDFTFVDDVVEAVCRVLPRPPGPCSSWSSLKPATSSSSAPWRIFNIGNHTPVSVNELIRTLEVLCGVPAKRTSVPKPQGDVDITFASVHRLSAQFNFSPSTSLESGLRQFIDWFVRWRSGEYL